MVLLLLLSLAFETIHNHDESCIDSAQCYLFHVKHHPLSPRRGKLRGTHRSAIGIKMVNTSALIVKVKVFGV